MDYFKQESIRLRFRKLTEADIPSWVEFFIDNDRLHFLGIDDLSKGKEKLAKDWIMAQLNRYEKQGLGHLAVELKETGQFIGMGGILPRELNEQEVYEIAFSIKPKFWGKGYATETAKQLKKFGFENLALNQLISIIDIANLDSIKVAKKNGMTVFFRTVYLGMNVDVYGLEKP